MVPGGVVGWIVLGRSMCNQLVQEGNLIVRIPKYKNCSVQNIFRTDGKTPGVWTVYCISVWDRARTGLGRETRETTTGCLPNFYQENRSTNEIRGPDSRVFELSEKEK